MKTQQIHIRQFSCLRKARHLRLASTTIQKTLPHEAKNHRNARPQPKDDTSTMPRQYVDCMWRCCRLDNVHDAPERVSNAILIGKSNCTCQIKRTKDKRRKPAPPLSWRMGEYRRGLPGPAVNITDRFVFPLTSSLISSDLDIVA